MARGRAPARRVLQSVLFTDIVKSTERLTEVGDAGWQALVLRHHSIVRTQIRRHRGREVDTAGDGFLISFEQPLDAVLCAMDVVRGVRALGIDVRAGIHTGEVERMGAKIGGIAVHTAARVMGAAEPGEILVSSTVQDLVAGSGTEFVDRGLHELRGVGERRLFAVMVPESVPAAETAGEVTRDDRARPRSFRRLAAFAAVVATLFVVGVVAGILSLGRGAALPSGANTVIALSRSSGSQTAGAYVDDGPASMAVASNALWIANIDGSTVSRVDVSTGVAQAIGNVGSRPGAIAADEDGVWVADAFDDRVVEIEPSTTRAAGSLDGAHASAIAVAFGSVWLADDVGDQVVRVDPATRSVASHIALPPASGPSSLAGDVDRLWVGLRRSGQIVAIDPNSGQLSPTSIPLGDVAALAASEGAVWALSTGDDTLARIDASGMRIGDTIGVCDNPVALATADDGVWVACSIGRRLWHVSATGERLAEHMLSGLPTAVAVVGDRVWVTLRGE